jgi:hypothetical protein
MRLKTGLGGEIEALCYASAVPSMPRRPAAAVAAWIVASYVLVALVQTWPLSAHLSTRLTGDPSGDGGVYVWNTWVFGHELSDPHHGPFYTESILALNDAADLSLHNYTVFLDLVALPLQPLVGVVAAFNLAFLINIPLIGIGMYLLARRVGGAAVGVGEAWLAGLLFACTPYLVARAAGHYSLAAAAPLPFFAWLVDRVWERRRVIDAAGAGACAAWAFYCDPYFAVYCVWIAMALIASRVLTVRARWSRTPSAATRALDALIVVLVVLVAVIGAGGRTMAIGSLSISMRSLYTPMLLLGMLLAIRIWLFARPRFSRAAPAAIDRRAMGLALMIGAVAAGLIAPVLAALARRAMTGGLVGVPVPWRSSAPGVDLLSFLLPNPNHPWAPAAVIRWLAHEPNGYVENVASLSWVALIVIALAWWRTRVRPDGRWVLIAAGAASLAVGPFLRIAGVDTLLPTPWTFIRYVPLLDEARMPGRIAIVVAMAVAVLFAGALAALTRRAPSQRRAILAIVGVALVCELWPAPRPLFSATIPAVYEIIRRDPRPVSVLELPFGIKDGLIDNGSFGPGAQFRQIAHGKRLIGGYLSRVSDRTRERYQTQPVTAALIALSEGRTLSPAERADAIAAVPDFEQAVELGYVVINEKRISPALRAFALEAFALRERGRGDRFAVFEPGR